MEASSGIGLGVTPGIGVRKGDGGDYLKVGQQEQKQQQEHTALLTSLAQNFGRMVGRCQAVAQDPCPT